MTVIAMPAMSGGMWAGLVAMSLVGVIALAWSQDVWPTGAAWTRIAVTLAIVVVLVALASRSTQAWFYDTTAYCTMNSWWDIWTC